LECHIDVAADTCTSLIINKLLDHAQARWAVVGAYGDNLDGQASLLGQSLDLGVNELADLQQLGICLNYNGYGFDPGDLMFHPAELFRLIHPYPDPRDFIENETAYTELLEQFQDDMACAQDANADSESSAGAVYLLPDEGWARRIVGVMGNGLAKQLPGRAHAVLVDMGEGHHRVSVRGPYNRAGGADELCRQFPSGGGRKAAAGIDALPQGSLAEFIDQFSLQF
ncbi:MAG: hypothetical protein GY815_15430, partial [Gammaproteobacteria bacterium]|nr:hypothetical protein [Gammaproteobacteria bacterium]